MRLNKTLLFAFCLLFGSTIALQGQTTTQAPDEDVLGQVIRETRRMYESGVPHKDIAAWVTQVVDNRLINSNSSEFFERPFYAWYGVSKVRNNPSTADQKYNEIANAAWEFGYGNCGENSMVAYYILKKAGVKENLRIIQSGKNRSHSFTVWGMPSDADTRDPLSWGDAIVVDPWLGYNIDGQEVRENYWFQNGDKNVIMRDGTTLFDEEATDWNTIVREESRRTGKKPHDFEYDIENEDCFIATAVYGTPNNIQINILRKYRDHKLRNTLLGRCFIKCYETFGPTAAYFIRGNEKRKSWVRKHIVEPAVNLAKNKVEDEN